MKEYTVSTFADELGVSWNSVYKAAREIHPNEEWGKHHSVDHVLDDLLEKYSNSSKLKVRGVVNKIRNNEPLTPVKFNQKAKVFSKTDMTYSDFCEQFGSQNLVKFDNSWCIYFLVNDNHIVYVGKSSKGGIWSRMKSHKADKVFESYFIMDGLKTEENALKLEGSFITLLNPRYNKVGQSPDPSQLGFMVKWMSNKSNKKKSILHDKQKMPEAIFGIFISLFFFFSSTLDIASDLFNFHVKDSTYLSIAFFLLPLSFLIFLYYASKHDNAHQ